MSIFSLIDYTLLLQSFCKAPILVLELVIKCSLWHTFLHIYSLTLTQEAHDEKTFLWHFYFLCISTTIPHCLKITGSYFRVEHFQQFSSILLLYLVWANGTVLRPLLQPESPFRHKSLVSIFKCKIQDLNSWLPCWEIDGLAPLLNTIHNLSISNEYYWSQERKDVTFLGHESDLCFVYFKISAGLQYSPSSSWWGYNTFSMWNINKLHAQPDTWCCNHF